MRPKNVLLVSLLSLLISFSCQSNYEKLAMDFAEEETMAPVPEQRQPEEPNNEEIERKLIKEGWIEFETASIDSTRKNISSALKKYNGYISSDREFKSAGRISNTVVVRVPAEHFDTFLRAATKGVDKLDSKEINVKDVTEEFLDIQARLKTKKELETRYLELLKKAQNVTEIIKIEKQIGELRSDIESIEGRLKYLKNKVAFSTLTITFYEEVPVESEFGEKFSNGFKNGWDNLIWFFVLLTNVWPFVLIVIALLFGIRVYRKRRNDKN